MDLVQPNFFAIGELHQAVLRCIDHPKYLARCARVNREWYNSSVPLLWRGYYDYFSMWRGPYDYQSPWLTPDVEFLVKLAESPDRFRHYVSFVDILVLRHNQKDEHQWHDEDPRADMLLRTDSALWSTFTGSSIVVDLEWIQFNLDLLRVLIHPAIESLSVLCGDYSNDFLRYLSQTCTIRLLELPCEPNDIVSSAQLLPSCIQPNSLEHLFLVGFENMPDEDVCESIFGSPEICSIAWTLRSLHLDLACPNLRNVFQSLPNLESLRLTTAFYCAPGWDINVELFRPIIVCSKLRELSVAYGDDLDGLDYTDFFNFAQNCPLVEQLKLRNYNIASGTLSSNQILTSVSLWPNLTSLILTPSISNITRMETTLIAKNCPKLTYLELNGPVTADAFDDENVVFPRLQHTSFKGIVCDPFPTSREERVLYRQNFKTAMSNAMPQLHIIHPPSFTIHDTNGQASFDGMITYEYPPQRSDDSCPKVREYEPMALRERIRLQILQKQHRSRL